jgi:hypothetical protein
MGNSKGTEITLISVTIAMVAMTSLFAANVTIAPQQSDAFSRHEIDIGTADVANGKTDQKLQQDDIGNTAKPTPTIPTLPSVPTVACAKEPIESLQSFLSCLGAK